jgi:hypothetical protein
MRAANHVKALAGFCGIISLFGAAAIAAAADEKNLYPNMAPAEQYRMASATEEIALARSAAPTSISADAEVMVLGQHGYETAIKGKNGFVCLVERAWFATFDDPNFWNPHTRGPDCYNHAAATSVLPVSLERTQWILSGLSKDEIMTRSQSSAAARVPPAQGSVGYMMSKQQHLGDDGHWHPHVMLFQPHTATAAWGANLPGSPFFASDGGTASEATIFVVPVGKWSDGTAFAPETH